MQSELCRQFPRHFMFTVYSRDHSPVCCFRFFLRRCGRYIFNVSLCDLHRISNVPSGKVEEESDFVGEKQREWEEKKSKKWSTTISTISIYSDCAHLTATQKKAAIPAERATRSYPCGIKKTNGTLCELLYAAHITCIKNKLDFISAYFLL